MRLYPRDFRERFLDEMIEFFRARRIEQRYRYGARGSLRLWIHLIADVAVNAPVQHMRAIGSGTARDLPWATPEYPRERHPVDMLKQDIRYALRTLLRHPAFTLVAALTLALGIGATTAIFSVVDAVLLRPLPWPDSERLVIVYGTRGENLTGGAAYLDYKDWREQSSAFESMGVIRGQSVNLTGTESPERLIGSFTTASMLEMLGATPVQGRLFRSEETEVATRQPVAVVNETLWRTRFGSRPDILGSTLTLNGQAFTVVGIIPAGFVTPLGSPDVWMPIGYYPNRGDLETRGRAGVQVYGKIKPSAAIETAQAELDGIAARLAAEFPTTNAGTGANVRPLKAELVGDSRTPLLVVLGSVAIVLLIACANVANLNLARAAARRRELSVRAALGAGRERLMRQLLTESLVLSLIGGLAGLAIAYAGVRWFATVLPDMLPIYGELTLSGKVLGFAAGVTLLAAILFGVAPAWQASRAQLQQLLTVRGDGSIGARLGGRGAIVIGEIALCMVLLVCAGLLTRSLLALASVEPGFDPHRLLTLQFRLPAAKYDSEPKIAAMFDRTITEIRAVPGVEAAALVRATPLNGNGERFQYAMKGVDATDRDRLPSAHRNIVTPGYFPTMDIPRLAGRDFTAEDRQGAEPVAVVNENLARKLAPQGSALGKQVQLMDGDDPIWLTVVGVVGNTRHFTLAEPPLDQVYVPVAQKPLIFTEVVVRTVGEPMTVANAVRAAIWRVDPEQPVWRIRPVTEAVQGVLASRELTMRLLGSFAVLAVVLAMIGVYGVMSYMVARRSQEMGVRMALGARPTQVVGMVLRQGMRTIAIAIVLGLVASYGATAVLETQLFGVGRTDPFTFTLVPLLLAGVALVACYLPARRASRVDPVVALRAD
jgi:putative ABC transport system permease protein